jgi:N-acetylneuraminate synthase
MKIIELFTGYHKWQDRIIKPVIVAEAGVNHEGKMELAKRLIEEAKEGGADAIKFQTYKAQTLASRNSPAYWDMKKEPTASQFKLFQKYDKFWKSEFEQLKLYCDKMKIDFISTPFDLESARFLNDLMDVFKISSSDITNKPFIDFICQFNKPIMLSTGASYLYEVEEAVGWISRYQNPLALLHCILNYPTLPENANLGMIVNLKQKYPHHIIGYSDHTPAEHIKALEVAWLLGAVIIEKHFTFDKTLPGNDHYHAMDHKDLKKLVTNIDQLYHYTGSMNKTVLTTEEISRKNARRSLVAYRLIPKGKAIDAADMTWKRPAFGISPKYYQDVIGKTALKDIAQDEILQWNMLS